MSAAGSAWKLHRDKCGKCRVPALADSCADGLRLRADVEAERESFPRPVRQMEGQLSLLELPE